MFEHYLRELQNYLTGKLGDRDAASDLAQECYLRGLAMQEKGETVSDARALLYRIANNLLIDRYRRQAVRSDVQSFEELEGGELQALAAEASEPETAAISAQTVAAMLAVIEALPPRCREAFLLFKFDGLSYREVAQRMGISVRTVEMQLQVAMSSCWACLEKVNPERRDALKKAGRQAKIPQSSDE